MTPTPDPTPTPATRTEFANLDATNAGYAETAISRVADSRPRAGSVTQSSNAINNVTQDRVSVTAEYGANRNSYSIRNGSSWSISTSNGNPADLDTTPPWDGQELRRRVNGGTLYVDVYSDIEAPVTRSVAGPGGTPVRLEDALGSRIGGLTIDEINDRMGDGTLDGVAGTFSCDLAGGNRCPVRFGFPTVDFSDTDWIFTPQGLSTHTELTSDTDYLAGGVWLFVPDSATSADDFESGAFVDGNDPFRQSNLMALTGAARYVGEATGVYSWSSATEGIGYWDANASLTANFGGASDLGTISGSISEIDVDGERTVGSFTLGQANIGPSDHGFFEGRLNGTVESSSGDIDYSGRWGGQFFGNSETDRKPGSVAGTLGGASSDSRGSASFVGVFGAHKRP